MVDHAVGKMGWGLESETTNTKRSFESRFRDRMIAENPSRFEMREAKALKPGVLAAWDKLQKDCGRIGDNSCDMSLLIYLAFKKRWKWWPQDIGSCFKAGTLIRMADGSHKRIEDVKPFDHVLTAEGGLGQVVAAKGRTANERMYQVKLWGHFQVEMTGEHPILTKRGYVKACELRMDDYVAVTRYLPAMKANALHTHEHVRLNAQSRRKYAKAESHCIGEHKTCNGSVKVYGRVPEVIELNYQFGWVCGIYAAEGCPDGNKVVWTFHKDELDTHVSKLVSILRKCFDVEASISCKGGKHKTCKVTVHSVAWSSLMESICGKGSSAKGLHQDLTTANEDFLRGMWDGWRDGDGHVREHVAQGTSVSKQLALDMHAIANGLGLMPNIVAHDPNVSHGVKHRCRRYDIRVSGTEEKMCCEQTDTHVWRKVRSISEYNFQGNVYNFEVTGDNSYVADGLGVHNCVWSNTWRIIIPRMIYEIGLRGDPEEYFGRSEAGQFSIAPHAATYGFAREIANMRNVGDGLYASAMAKALSKGMIMCSTPKLMELSKAAGADKPSNFPEPRNPGLYRRIGDWAWNDALRPYLCCPITELPPVTDYTTHVALSEAGKPIFQCSSIAIKKVGKHKDGFTIHERDPNNSWAHNMGHMGHFYDSTGDRWHRFANLSWLNDPNPEAANDEFDDYEYSEAGIWVPKKPIGDNPDPLPNWDDELETYIYNIRADHLESWYTKKLVDSYGIGEIDMPDSTVLTV